MDTKRPSDVLALRLTPAQESRLLSGGGRETWPGPAYPHTRPGLRWPKPNPNRNRKGASRARPRNRLAKARDCWELRLRSKTARHIATAQQKNPDLSEPEIRQAMGWSKGQAQDFIRGPVSRVEPYED